jgi:hypothetical protein
VAWLAGRHPIRLVIANGHKAKVGDLCNDLQVALGNTSTAY